MRWMLEKVAMQFIFAGMLILALSSKEGRETVERIGKACREAAK